MEAAKDRMNKEGFDSILVRLKAPFVVPENTPAKKFRFHTGSIKRQ